MDQPDFTHYVTLIHTYCDRFAQQLVACAKRGRPYVYQQKVLIVFFMVMQLRRIFQFKTQWNWLKSHPDQREQLGFTSLPHRTTLSRRYKALAPVIEEFIVFLGREVEELDERFDSRDLFEDKSLFKAQGPVWHQSDRKVNRIPDKLRNLDTDATWSKSGYHGWVYGYGFHLTCNAAGFPKLIQTETASVSEKQVLDDKTDHILHLLCPDTLTGDNGYTKAMRVRNWAKQGVALLTPATSWVKGRYAQAYHVYIEQPLNAALLKLRKTAIEPIFDLIAKIIGATANDNQLPLNSLVNVRTCLALACLTLQIAMIANSIWNLPFRHISTIQGVFA
ncbi:MAG: hypothetical protein GY833_18605 [Aestuariibacter sp.]|nr:hypothetical protein [Aestuariibacter sp.]